MIRRSADFISFLLYEIPTHREGCPCHLLHIMKDIVITLLLCAFLTCDQEDLLAEIDFLRRAFSKLVWPRQALDV